ncbi:MAG: hypothetical protein ACJ72E_00785 [Marmoricola sp.]
MIDLSISTGALAHAIHYTVVGAGLVGLLVLIGPQLLGRPPRRALRDEHERRVAHLGEQIAAGSLGSTLTAFPVALAQRTTAEPPRDPRSSLLVPVAILSSAAAAAVHAAVGPEHFRERFLFGLFFACAALCQVTWSLLAAARPSRWLLEAAAVGNVAAIALWAATRTVGLGSLLPSPEQIGAWDVTCVAWELVTVLCCVALLRAPGRPPRMPSWDGWDVAARVWAIGSVVVLVGLRVSGADA